MARRICASALHGRWRRPGRRVAPTAPVLRSGIRRAWLRARAPLPDRGPDKARAPGRRWCAYGSSPERTRARGCLQCALAQTKTAPRGRFLLSPICRSGLVVATLGQVVIDDFGGGPLEGFAFGAFALGLFHFLDHRQIDPAAGDFA